MNSDDLNSANSSSQSGSMELATQSTRAGAKFAVIYAVQAASWPCLFCAEDPSPNPILSRATAAPSAGARNSTTGSALLLRQKSRSNMR